MNTYRHYCRLKQKGPFSGSAKAAYEKHRQRVVNRPPDPLPPGRTLRPNGKHRHDQLIPLGGHTITPPKHPQASLRNRAEDRSAWKTREEKTSGGLRGGWVSYRYQTFVEAWGRVCRGHLLARIDTDDGLQTLLFRPWRGWQWKIDEVGIVLVDSRGKRDYHPTAADLLKHHTTREIAALAREYNTRRRAERRWQRRWEQHRREVIKRAEREGARVCLADSVRAGNCRAGSESWCRRHGLDPKTHVSPSELLSLANGDTERVAIVVGVALRRHAAEMRRGRCDLAEHRN